MKTLKDLNVNNKRVLVRCDFNVPLNSDGSIADDFRIKKSLPTIERLIENKAKIILMSHLDPDNEGLASPNFTLNAVAHRLSEHLSRPVKKTDDCVGGDVLEEINKLSPGEILLLENLRFYKEETENSYEFAKKLSELGEIYINDAFSVCHRAHASVVGVPKILPHGIGLLLVEEIKNLTKILENPARPMVAIIGGAKVETKAKFIEKILEVADCIIVSGLIKKEMIEKNLKFKNSKKITGPASNLEALDIDEETIKTFKEKILSAKTILWNGPFGKFEDENYKRGTLEIAKAIIESGAFSVVGGGETVEFLSKERLSLSFSHISAGGGAMLSYLAGEKLPGIEALQ